MKLLGNALVLHDEGTKQDRKDIQQFNEKLSGYMTELEELMHESEKSHQELLVALGSMRYDL